MLVFRCLHGTAPPYLANELCRMADIDARRRLRSASTSALVTPPSRRSTIDDRAFFVAAPRVWNSLPSSVTASQTLGTFRRGLKTSSTPTYGSFCCPYAGRLRPVSVPNLKQVALYVQKLLGGHKIMKLGHVTPATPTYGRFVIPVQGGSVLYVCTKFEADRSFCVRGSQISPRRRPLSRGPGPPKFNQLEMVTTCTYRSTLVKIDACNFELSW